MNVEEKEVVDSLIVLIDLKLKKSMRRITRVFHADFETPESYLLLEIDFYNHMLELFDDSDVNKTYLNSEQNECISKHIKDKLEELRSLLSATLSKDNG